MGGCFLLLVFWLVCSMPTNTHTLFYRTCILDVTLDDLKQSSSVKQLADIVLGLERNGQSTDPVEANTTKLRVLKDRDFGSKGLAAAVVYDKETTRLVENSLEEFEDFFDN